MARVIVDIWLDGYETIEERTDAELEFIYEQLNMTASSVDIIPHMEWTKEMPKETGNYWWRAPKYQHPQIVKVWFTESGIYASGGHLSGGSKTHMLNDYDIDGQEWSDRPIPIPHEED